MPDFRRWLLDASQPENPLPPGGFVWSPAKHFLFKKCPRAWFLRHYLAQGGWDVLSGESALHAYLLKYLAEPDAWMSATLERALSEALLEIAPVPIAGVDRAAALTEELQIRVSRQLRRARGELTREEYFSDPKLASFAALHYRTGEFASVDELISVLHARFAAFFRRWTDSDLPGELSAFEQLSWRLPPEHREFAWGFWRISLRPWLYAVRRSHVEAWRFTFTFGSGAAGATDWGDEAEECNLSERVLAAWAAGKYPGFPLRVTSVICTRDDLLSRRLFPVPVSAGFITESAEPMLRMANRPGGLKPECFARAKQPEACLSCCFRAVCAVLPFPPEEPDGESAFHSAKGK